MRIVTESPCDGWVKPVKPPKSPVEVGKCTCQHAMNMVYCNILDSCFGISLGLFLMNSFIVLSDPRSFGVS